MGFSLGFELTSAVLVEEVGVACFRWVWDQPLVGCFLDCVHEHGNCLHEVMGGG